MPGRCREEQQSPGLAVDFSVAVNPAGFEVLTAMEKVPTDDEDRPRREIKITGATVFVNPFKDEEEAERKDAEEARLKVHLSHLCCHPFPP